MSKAAKPTKTSAGKPVTAAKKMANAKNSKVRDKVNVEAKAKPSFKGTLKPETKANEPKAPGGQELKEQAQLFDKAMTLFHKRDFAKAGELFLKAAAGPAVEVAHSAQMRARICEARSAPAEPQLKTGEDYYNYGVSLMNGGNLEKAEHHLRKAVATQSDNDHFHYALALCCGLRGDYANSASHLRRAIEIEPSSRIAARNDSEFQSLSGQPALREILFPERQNAG